MIYCIIYLGYHNQNKPIQHKPTYNYFQCTSTYKSMYKHTWEGYIMLYQFISKYYKSNGIENVGFYTI